MSVALTPAEMDEIGAELVVLRPATCLIRRRSSTPDAGGGRQETFTDGATVSCRVAPANRAVIVGISGGQVVPEADFVIPVPRGTVVERGDQVVTGGVTYAVLNDPDAPSFQFELMLAVKAIKS